MLDFKKGAFIIDVPLRVIGLKYKCNFNNSLAFVKGIDEVIGTLCNFKTSLTVYETDGLIFY